MAKIVVALGGNAILSKDASAQAQMKAVKKTAKELVKFIKNGDQLIITHGNGPQVGNLLLQQNAADSAAGYLWCHDPGRHWLLVPKCHEGRAPE